MNVESITIDEGESDGEVVSSGMMLGSVQDDSGEDELAFDLGNALIGSLHCLSIIFYIFCHTKSADIERHRHVR